MQQDTLQHAMAWTVPTFDAATAIRGSPLHRVRNGDPRRSEFLELTVYPKVYDGSTAAANVVRKILTDLADATHISPEHLRIVNSEPVSGEVRSVRVSWQSYVWWWEWDMLGGLEVLRSALNDHGRHVALWSNAPTVDKRCCAKLIFKGTANRSTCLDPVSARIWTQKFFPSMGVQLSVEAQSNRGHHSSTLSIRCQCPTDVDVLASILTVHTPTVQSNSVRLQRPTDQINVQFPTCLVSPQRTDCEQFYLLDALDKWVAEFNSKHEAAETLLPCENGERSMLVSKSFVVMPSSMGLAQFITDQMPYFGHPFEFCYELNERNLIPRKEAEEKKRLQTEEIMRQFEIRLENVTRILSAFRQCLDSLGL